MSSVEAIELLGGAARIRTRVRGFAPWSPRGETLQLLDQVRAVLGEYENYLPLTIRQIFYRLVGAHRYEKTEQAYERLIEHLNRARRARLISFDAIRDDTSVVSEPDHWRSEAQFWATIRQMAKDFTLDRSDGQATRLVVMCEAAGMVPQPRTNQLSRSVRESPRQGARRVLESALTIQPLVDHPLRTDSPEPAARASGAILQQRS